MNEHYERVNEIAEEALDLPAAKRQRFVSRRCGSDPDLLESVQRLLSLSNSLDGFLESPPVPLGEIRPGDVLGGRFRIVEELGAGSSGATSWQRIATWVKLP